MTREEAILYVSFQIDDAHDGRTAKPADVNLDDRLVEPEHDSRDETKNTGHAEHREKMARGGVAISKRAFLQNPALLMNELMTAELR